MLRQLRSIILKLYLALAFSFLCLPARAFDLFEEAEKAGLINAQAHPLSRSLAAPFSDYESWIGIVGDSSTTGAFASPRMQATWLTVLNQVIDFANDDRLLSLRPRIQDYPNAKFFHLQEPIQSLERVLYTRSEFTAAEQSNQAFELDLSAQASLRVNTSEYTFGYMIGKYWKLPEDHIVLAGQDGSTISAMGQQFLRLFETGAKHLPPLVLVSFVANDFCGTENFSRPTEVFAQRYSQVLSQQMRVLAALPSAPQGTRILFLAPLDIASLWSNPNISKQKVPFDPYGSVSCKSLRDPSVASNDPAKVMQDMLVSECRGLLEPTQDPAAHVQKIRDLQKAQFAVLKSAIADLNVMNPALHAELATSVRKIDYQEGDVANDCFHPSVRGHSRIAQKLLKSELKTGL
jgi:hypothetical protein